MSNLTPAWPFPLHAAAAALLAGVGLIGCADGDSANPSAPTSLNVHVSVTPVTGANCTLTDNAGKTLAGNVFTQAGAASFLPVTAGTGLALVSCSGGTYIDPATGTTLTAPRMRTWASALGAAGSTAVVSPLTELAVRLLGTRSADTDYATTRGWVAQAFGLDKLNIATQVPTDVSVTAVTDSDASRYGMALAALSQLQIRGIEGATAEAVITSFAANFDANGHPKDSGPEDAYAHAIEALLQNPRLSSKLGTLGTTLARVLFENAEHDKPLSTILSVDGRATATESGTPSHSIQPGVPSSIVIGGKKLRLGLVVQLSGAHCTVTNLVTEDDETTTGTEEVTAECPAQSAGTATLVVSDAGTVVSQTVFTVVAQASASGLNRALAVTPAPAAGTGPATIAGTVTALAPTISTETGGHNYAVTRSFTVKGVVVELLDSGAANAVLMQTSTDANGTYRFTGVDAARQVIVRARAQLLKTRATGLTTGSQWSLAVRDNTSTTSPKAMYVLDSAPLLTVAGNNAMDLSAPTGFTADGTAISEEARRSGPFSILEVAYAAMSKIELSDPNVDFPEVNIYWSPKNTTSSGDKNLGQIETSHYTAASPFPGVFILGRADVDTDEFDQGVIGHELGHWLQAVASYSDNPGGSHAALNFKDASLAYGEGYGTALGGLLMDNPFYVDSLGSKQSSGGITNLDNPTAAGVRKGFYSQESVRYVMYQIGKRHGFTPFWRAVSAMRSDHFSATVFAFLNRFVIANPSANVADLLSAENLRSANPLGNLPAGLTPDAAIGANQNNGASVTGAGDLETLYIPVTLASVAAPTAAVTLTPNPPTFCINHNLPGAQSGNGLGMIKRFTFTANFTGPMGVRVVNDRGAALEDRDTTVDARSDRGVGARMLVWTGQDPNSVRLDVENGVTYTLRFRQLEANVFQGNRCGNTLSMWRLPV